jgi:hypothetical protein
MLGDLVKAVEVVRNWLAYNRNNRDVNKNQLLEALVELHRAANLTRSYLADVVVSGREGRELGRERQFPRETREQLSERWLTVGHHLSRCRDNHRDGHIQEVLSNLAERCFAKAEFWAAPQEWKESGIDIKLGSLVAEASDTIEELRNDGLPVQRRRGH